MNTPRSPFSVVLVFRYVFPSSHVTIFAPNRRDERQRQDWDDELFHVKCRTMQVVMGLLIAMFGAFFQSPTGEADEILAQLSKIHLDKKQVYTVRDITLRRDVLSLTFNRGTLAFLEPVKGTVTGAVFFGSGEIVAIPPDAIERQQVYRFTGTAILNEPFQTAVLRFNDDTYEEIKKEIAEHAQEEVDPEDLARFDSWDVVLARRSPALNVRLMGDFVEPSVKPFFFAELNGDKTGWFNVLFDLHATEEVAISQVRQLSTATVADIWSSFNQRSEARKPEGVAHENKSPIEVLSYDIVGSVADPNIIDARAEMRIKGRVDGARTVNFELAPGLRVSSVRTASDDSVPYFQPLDANAFLIVLPAALKVSEEFTLRIAYAGPYSAQGPPYPSVQQQVIPSFKSNFPLSASMAISDVEYAGHKLMKASYHDEWLIEGLRRYLPLMASESGDSGAAMRNALAQTREELKTVETAGPIWLGHRLASTKTPEAYRVVQDKGAWVIHMLRSLLRDDGPNPDKRFLDMLQDFAQTYDGKAVSTWDFEHSAEKAAKKPLDWFFDQWVFATGVPKYSLDYKVESAGNDFTIEGAITQTGVPDGFLMPVPVYADSEYLGTVQVGDSDGKFKFRVSKRPEQVRIDELSILTASTP